MTFLLDGTGPPCSGEALELGSVSSGSDSELRLELEGSGADASAGICGAGSVVEVPPGDALIVYNWLPGPSSLFRCVLNTHHKGFGT